MNDYLSNVEIKLIQSLKIRETRYAKKLFWAEGERTVSELILNKTVLYKGIVDDGHEILKTIFPKGSLVSICKERDINKIKSTKSFPGVAGIFQISEFQNFNKNIIFACNGINDPGNLGTIFRTALWFGYNDFLIDTMTVDPYHEKTIRASMGAVSKINFCFVNDLTSELLKYKNENFSIISADLSGYNFNEKSLSQKNIFVFGNEANGISKDILKISNEKVKIPKYGEGESLNVAVAYGILVSEIAKIKKTQFYKN